MSEINWERLKSAQKVWRLREKPTAQLSLLTDAGTDGKLDERLSSDREMCPESFQPGLTAERFKKG